jgi:predicted alpha/beta hydrolase family esterase
MHNKSAFLIMGHRLGSAGRNNVVALNFGPPSREVPFFAERLSETVKTTLAQTGCEKVDLVGHSMGGLVVRYYIEKLGGAAGVNAAVTLGAPHLGSKTAVFGVLKSAEQFSPDSALITELNEAPPSGDATDMTAVWSDFDSIVLPHESARLPEPYTSVKVGGVGHVAMLFSGRIFDETLRAISTNLPPRDFSNGAD